jgi:hypothetical protein
MKLLLDIDTVPLALTLRTLIDHCSVTRHTCYCTPLQLLRSLLCAGGHDARMCAAAVTLKTVTQRVTRHSAVAPLHRPPHVPVLQAALELLLQGHALLMKTAAGEVVCSDTSGAPPGLSLCRSCDSPSTGIYMHLQLHRNMYRYALVKSYSIPTFVTDPRETALQQVVYERCECLHSTSVTARRCCVHIVCECVR